jgi:hypothetical protein
MDSKTKRSQIFPLRLPPAVLETAQAVAKSDETSLNHFVCLALAEKLSSLERDCWLKRVAAGTQHGTRQRGPWLPRKVSYK